ncbi:hypothetical protein ACWEQU_22375, partial [Streptomyces nodosus]
SAPAARATVAAPRAAALFNPLIMFRPFCASRGFNPAVSRTCSAGDVSILPLRNRQIPEKRRLLLNANELLIQLK